LSFISRRAEPRHRKGLPILVLDEAATMFDQGGEASFVAESNEVVLAERTK
jgi:hypothetical protein